MDTITYMLSWMVTIFTIVLFLTGLLDCKKMVQSESTANVAFFPFLATHFSCGLWASYGYLTSDSTVITINCTGAVLSALYMMCYFLYSRQRNHQITMIVISAMVAFALEWYFVNVLHSAKMRIQYLGFASVLMSIVMQASPLSAVSTVVKTKSTASMPFAFSLMMVIVSSMWLAYGYRLNDSNIMAPNFTGITLGLLQLSLFLIYPSKPVGKKQ